jgi:hypothetical protein
MSQRIRLFLSIAVLIALAVVLVLQFPKLLNSLPPDDFVEYWAAGRLNAQGKNPYDPENLLTLEREAGRDTDEAVMMWNPPWTLTLAMPFGILDARVAQLLWLLCGFALMAASADLLWRTFDGPPSRRWIAWLLAFTFMPTFFVLGAGQIGAWVLAGIVLFLVSLQRGWPMLAGASTVLVAIKPHLAYLFWIVLIISGLRRDYRVLLGGVIAGLIATLIPMLFNPQVLQQYVQELSQRPPAQWKSPTLGTFIRKIEGPDQFFQQFIPPLLGLIWLAWYAWRSRNRKWNWNDQTPILLLVSFVTAAYGAWPFDLVILLPAVIHVAAGIARQPHPQSIAMGVAAWLLINVGALTMNLLKIDSEWFIWIAPVMLICYCAFTASRTQ